MDNTNISVMDNINRLKNGKRKRSVKDEITVIKAMLNDEDYETKILNNKLEEQSYYPGREFRNLISGIIKDITQMPNAELKYLMSNYTFNDKQAKTLLEFNKEFFNTYLLECNQSISLGKKPESYIQIHPKVISTKMRTYTNPNNGKKIRIENLEYKTVHVKKSPPKWLQTKTIINNEDNNA